ncbi:MAG: hypothetical protein ACE5KV_08510, partial [Thermoplasmata archaeon]
VTLHGFPELEELESSEVKELFVALHELNKGIGQLFGLRSRVAKRLGEGERDESTDNLKETIKSCFVPTISEKSILTPLDLEIEKRKGQVLERRAEEAFELGKRTQDTKARRDYEEAPLVVSSSVLAHMLRAIRAERIGEDVRMNFRFYSYIKGFLAIASAAWRIHLTSEGHDEDSIAEELKDLGLDQKGIEEKSLKVSNRALREVIRERRSLLNEKKERLEDLRQRTRRLSDYSDELWDIAAEASSILMERLEPSAPRHETLQHMKETIASLAPESLQPLRDSLLQCLDDLIAEVLALDGRLKDLSSILEDTNKVKDFLRLTRGQRAPLPEQLGELGLDLKGLVRKYFPPSMTVS